MLSQLSFVSACTALVFVASGVQAMDREADEARFVDRGEEGWFWYRDPPVEAEEEEPKAPEQVEQATETIAAAAAPSGPQPLSAEWIEANIKRYQMRATDDPTPDNVRAFLLLQKVMMDKAQTFSDVARMVTVGDPLLDATFQRPLAPFASDAVDRAAFNAGMALLKHLSQHAGFVFFFRSDCQFCDQQAPRLQAVAEYVGLEVLAVSLDGRPMPSGAFPNFTVDRGQAAQLGVMTTPTIMLMRPPSDVEPVAQGVVTEYELIERTLLAARRKGWISQEAFEATKPYQRVRAVVSPHEIPERILEDPAAFTAYLRAAMLQ